MTVKRLETPEAYLTEIKELEDYLLHKSAEMVHATDPQLRQAIGDSCNNTLEDLWMIKYSGVGKVACAEETA